MSSSHREPLLDSFNESRPEPLEQTSPTSATPQAGSAANGDMCTTVNKRDAQEEHHDSLNNAILAENKAHILVKNISATSSASLPSDSSSDSAFILASGKHEPYVFDGIPDSGSKDDDDKQPQVYLQNQILDEEERVGLSGGCGDDGTLDDDDPLSEPKRKESLRQKAQHFFYWLIFAHAGVKLLLLAQVFNSAMIAFTRILETASDPPFHPFQILFSRMIITYIGCVGYMYYKKVPDFLLGAKGIRLLLMCRGVLGFFGVFGLYYSVNYLDISDAAVITFLTPAVTAVFAWYFLNEPLLPIEIVAGFFALAGVTIISKPSFLFKYFQHSPDFTKGDDNGIPEAMRIRAVLVALLGVCGASSVYIVIRKIGRRAHALIFVSYFSMWSLVVSTVGLLCTPGLGFVFPRTLTEWSLLFLLGIFGFLFQFCLTAGIQRVTAARAAAATYTLMLWTLMWEKLIWNKTPDRWSICGGILILGSGMIVAVFKWWDSKEKAKISLPEGDEPSSRRQSRDRRPSRSSRDDDEDEDGGYRNEAAPLLGDGSYGDSEDAISSDLESQSSDQDSHERHRYSFSISHAIGPDIPLQDLPPEASQVSTTQKHNDDEPTQDEESRKHHDTPKRLRHSAVQATTVFAPGVKTDNGTVATPRSGYSRVYDGGSRNDFLSTSSTVV